MYGTYEESGKVKQIKAPVTDKVILRHLQGEIPYGIYLLVKDKIRAIAVDFDNGHAIEPIDFINTAKHYLIPSYVERSKSKGYHVWIFFNYPVKAYKARLVVSYILQQIGKPHTEIFPKHDELDTNIAYGNFINAPLFGTLVKQKRTVFVNPENSMKAYDNQWNFLSNVKRVSETTLEEIIEINELKKNNFDISLKHKLPYSHSLGLLPCAQRILNDGVKDYQRVSCFRLGNSLEKSRFSF